MDKEELTAKLKEAKSADEILALAKESGVELSEEKAKELFAELNANGELSDDELDKVAGGEEFGVIISRDEIVSSFLKAMEQYRKEHPKG